MSIFNDVKYQLRNGSAITRLIIINLLVFAIVNVLWLISFLSGNGNYLSAIAVKWLALPASVTNLLFKPWTLFTYMFLHEDIMHLIFNLIFLFFGGRLFEDLLGTRRLTPVYILGGLSGALLYILAFNVFPVFQDVLYGSVALGASASALAILVAIAGYLPDYSVHLLFFGQVRLKWIAVIAVVLDIFSITRGNAGGHIAHLGGALFGYIYALQLKKGNDIGLWFSNFLARINNKLSRKSNLKVAYKNTTKNAQPTTKPKQEIIDQILDKISRSGYGSLTKEEKDLLFKLSKDH